MPRVIAIVALACAVGAVPLAAQERTDSTASRPVALNPQRLTVGRDSFAILLQGNPFGAFIRTRERDPSHVTTTTEFVISGGAQSATYVLDASTLAPVSYDQTANQGGQSIELHLIYGADGHITGTIAGALDVTVDTVIQSIVYDEDMLPTLAEALELEDGSRHELDLFVAPRSATMPVALAVLDGGTVAVPAGEFETWLVTLEGGQLPWIYWVTKELPRRIVKMEITGQLSFELVSAGSQ